MENQKKNQWISPEEAYIYVGQQKLRRGYTTGSCAAAAAQAAARVLFGEEEPKTVELTVPKGLTLCIPVHSVQKYEGQAQASVCKDSGDDPDVTDHIEVVVSIQPNPTPGITIRGGQGVGRVTKPGLEMPVGEAAINKTPRRMIREQIELVQQEHPEWEGVGLLVTVSIP
ncbi:MAG: cobalt-precorrin-5B (C(1))-methyltransferase, partial [Negativibacillus massiliensis]